MDFWKDKNVLITGASGFVGSNLTKRLIKEGARITVLIEKSIPKTSILSSENLLDRIDKVQVGSVTDFELLSNLIYQRKTSVIFHLAAQPLVDIAQNSPLITFQTNIEGTWNILEAARIHNTNKIIIASTAHVYGDAPNLPHVESQDPHPSRPYETSKAASDLLAQSYADTYDLPVEIPRFTNIYGPGDFNLNRIVPKTIDTILHDQNVELWNVGAVRDFLYIDDAVNAYLTLASSNLPNTKRHRVFNFGSGKPISIKELVELIIDISGKDVRLKMIFTPKLRDKEIARQYVSIEKAKNLLGWQPKVLIDDGIKKTYEWYKEKNS